MESLVAVAVILAPLLAQQTSGEIRLQVKDSSGAAAQAGGTVRDLAAGTEKHFETDAQGSYEFRGLAFGRYEIQVTRRGFATQVFAVDVNAPVVSVSATLILLPQATSIDVVTTTPLPGSDVARDQLPTPVQTASAKDLENSSALNLADLLNKRLNGIHINENQGNPFQPDINYRGYTASPLLGTPEGISVYMDGVRQNQPFGDIVAWDLIPRIAIAEVALMPGSTRCLASIRWVARYRLRLKTATVRPARRYR